MASSAAPSRLLVCRPCVVRAVMTHGYDLRPRWQTTAPLLPTFQQLRGWVFGQ